eukprot:c18286_g1_i1.p1 GENE.c18286_g1_i1~~c18286_g1_i1.p1  ORF type:complete len:658 (+),score=173.37 c18286_g1_i1:52-2025(+)
MSTKRDLSTHVQLLTSVFSNSDKLSKFNSAISQAVAPDPDDPDVWTDEHIQSTTFDPNKQRLLSAIEAPFAFTVLHCACSVDDVDLLKAVLLFDPDIDAKVAKDNIVTGKNSQGISFDVDKHDGHTPLCVAVYHQRDEAVKIILKLGPKLSTPIAPNCSLLDYSITKHNNYKCTFALLEHFQCHMIKYKFNDIRYLVMALVQRDTKSPSSTSSPPNPAVSKLLQQFNPPKNPKWTESTDNQPFLNVGQALLPLVGALWARKHQAVSSVNWASIAEQLAKKWGIAGSFAISFKSEIKETDVAYAVLGAVFLDSQDFNDTTQIWNWLDNNIAPELNIAGLTKELQSVSLSSGSAPSKLTTATPPSSQQVNVVASTQPHSHASFNLFPQQPSSSHSTPPPSQPPPQTPPPAQYTPQPPQTPLQQQMQQQLQQQQLPQQSQLQQQQPQPQIQQYQTQPPSQYQTQLPPYQQQPPQYQPPQYLPPQSFAPQLYAPQSQAPYDPLLTQPPPYPLQPQQQQSYPYPSPAAQPPYAPPVYQQQQQVPPYQQPPYYSQQQQQQTPYPSYPGAIGVTNNLASILNPALEVGNPVSDLQNLCQRLNKGRLPDYTFMSPEGPSHNPTFTAHVTVHIHNIAAIGSGPTKKAAKSDAAEKALALLTQALGT